MALPNELSLEAQVALTKRYVMENCVSLGMCADVAIHEGLYVADNKPVSIEPVYVRKNNPHVHVLLTTRMVDRNGFYRLKCRDWDKRSYVTLWRREWADAQNREFERLGLDVRVSHESLAVQGIKREPTMHLGPTVMTLELRGISTDRGDEYRTTLVRNRGRERERIRERERVRERTRTREFERTR
jgi:hypothetical protein